MCLLGENPKNPRVLGKEQRAVSQDRDLALSRPEQPDPVGLEKTNVAVTC